MGNLKRSIKVIVREAEKHNARKLAATTELESGLGTYSEKYVTATKRFIKVINDNVEARQTLINKIKDITILKDPQRVLDITYKFQSLDDEDVKASKVCRAIIGEEAW